MPRHISKRLATLAVIAVLVIIVVGTIAGGSPSDGSAWVGVIRVIVAAGALGLLGWIVFYTTDIESPPPPDRPKPIPPNNHEIARAYSNIVQNYDRQALKLLVNMMIDRPHYLERIHEFVTVEEEVPRLRVATRQIFRMQEFARPPGAPPDVLLVPIVVLEKGTLLDGFTVADEAGNDLPTLSYNQTRGLLAYVIEAVIDIAPSSQSSSQSRDEQTKRRVAGSLVTAVCSPTPRKKKDAESLQAVEKLLNATNDLPVSAEQVRRIKGFCEIFADHYVIVAEVPAPAGGHSIITYHQEISIDSSALGLVNQLRSRIGLRYSTFDIPLNIFSLDVETYHMEMDAGPMQFVFDHHLERMNSRTRLTQEDLRRGPSEPYVRLHYNSAAPAMHLYIRRQSQESSPASTDAEPAEPTRADAVAVPRDGKAPIERLKSVVEFREVPPGTLGAATVISVLTTLIISFFALTQLGQETTAHAHPAPGSDVPALIIALPGLASLVIGSWLDLSHLRRASLTTYLSLAASIVLSLSAALYFLLGANKMLTGGIALSVASGIMIRTNVGWLVLAGCAVTCTLMVFRDMVSGSRYYYNQVKERVRRHT